MTAITLCGPAMECSACGVWPPVREQYGPCDVHAHAAIGQRCLAASICWRATSSLVRHRILARPSSLTHVCSNAATDPFIMLCLQHVAHARVEFSGTRVPLCSCCPFLFVLGSCLLVLLVSGTLQCKCQSRCSRSVVKSKHHGRWNVAPVAKHNPCLFDGTRGMQTRQTCLCCCFFSPGCS